MWIHAASKELDATEVEAVETQYEHLRAQFPKTYPISALIGCVDVIDVLSKDELQARKEQWEADGGVDESVSYVTEDNGSEYVFVCTNPKKLPVPLACSGQHKLCTLFRTTVAECSN
jgi:hypothetical protein